MSIHASCVAFEGRAVLIKGASGVGKSGLSLQLLAYGAQLVADDQTVVENQGSELIAHALPGFSGMIEARGIGLIGAPICALARVVLVVDLDQVEKERLPPSRVETLLGCDVPLIYGPITPHFPAAIVQLIRYGWLM